MLSRAKPRRAERSEVESRGEQPGPGPKYSEYDGVAGVKASREWACK